MRALSGEQMLMAWEHCHTRPAQKAALALLALASPEQSADELASLPLAERNAMLLELRAETLGPRMEGFAVCPECGAQLEFALDAQELARGLQAPAAEPAGEGLTMRPVNTGDLLACLEAADEQQARSILLSRALGFDKTDEAGDASGGAPEWLQSPPEAIIARFDRLNSSAEVRVQFDCAACQSRPILDLDIARYLIREMASTARRLMADIHELASAYGWSERSIAAMSGARRAAYLEMLSA